MRKKYIRVGFTAAQSSELWDRWQKGEGLKSIGRVLGKPSSCIFNHLRPSGGIRPAERTRSRLALTLVEREEISRGLCQTNANQVEFVIPGFRWTAQNTCDFQQPLGD